MIKFLKEYRQLLFLLLFYFIAELITNPAGNFPLNDDWAYAKALQILANEGRVDIGYWPAMTLVTHLLWGLIFVKLFGFTFLILRISSMISAIIGAVFLFRLVESMGANRKLALLSSAIMLFNPLMYNIANSYMTDVNFNTLLIISVFFTMRLFNTSNVRFFFPIFISYTALLFLRQFGLICFIALPLSCLFLKNKKWQFLGIAVMIAVSGLCFLKIYEAYLEKTLPTAAAYQFSSASFFSKPGWIKTLWWNFLGRYKPVAMYLFIYLFPLFLVTLISMARATKKVFLVIAALLCAGFTFLFFQNSYFPTGNLFENMRLGPENLFETWHNSAHTMVTGFDEVMFVIKIIYSAIGLLCVFLLVKKFADTEKLRGLARPLPVFLFTFFALYFCFLLFSEYYFDRYHIPLFTVTLLIAVYMFGTTEIQLRWAIVPVILMIYVSVAGTKDFIEMNRQKWAAVRYLRKEVKAPLSRIHAGFEHYGLGSKNGFDWNAFLDLKNFDYLIQYSPEPGFKLLKEYEFQRYFPCKKHKINIFVREQK